MEFHVEQPELRGIGLAHELGRVYARARRKGAFGKILFFLGLVTLVLGIMALIGTVLNAAELAEEIESTPAVIAVGLIMNLLMILLGLSWTGWGSVFNGWTMLLGLRGSKGDTRFYPDRIEDVDEGLCVSYQYTRVKAVFEGRRAFYLQLEAKRFLVLILQKKYFTQGEPDKFRRFMDKQCGKAVITV